MQKLILQTSFAEAIYLALSFTLAQIYGPWSITGELIRTAARLCSIIFLGVCFRQYCARQGTAMTRSFLSLGNALTMRFIAAVILLFLFAVLYTNGKGETPTWQGVFAASGLIAGLREEVFYRGILLTALLRRYRAGIALGLSTLVFTLIHLQYLLSGQFQSLLLISLAGTIFGCIFIFSGSLFLTALIHGAYDAVLAVDLLPFRLEANTAILVFFAITVLFLVLTFRFPGKGSIPFS